MTYTIDTHLSARSATVRVFDTDQRKVFSATAHYADLRKGKHAMVASGPLRVADPKLAEAAATALKRAAHRARESDARPLGFAPKFTAGPDQRLRVDTEEARELAAKHEREGRDDATRREGREGVYWAYSQSAKWDWELGEPVYSLGLGARVLYDVPESKLTPVE